MPPPTLERAQNPLPHELTFVGKIVGYDPEVGVKVEVVQRIQGELPDVVHVIAFCSSMGQLGDVRPFVENSFSIRQVVK
jgi:hypothetical protein